MGATPLGGEFGGTLGGHELNPHKVIWLIGVGLGGSFGGGYFMVHQLHLLLQLLYVGESIMLQIHRGVHMAQVGWQEVLSTSGDHGRGVVVGAVGHGIEGQHDERDFVDPALGILALGLDSSHNISNRAMTALIYGVPLRVIGRGEDSLHSIDIQELLP